MKKICKIAIETRETAISRLNDKVDASLRNKVSCQTDKTVEKMLTLDKEICLHLKPTLFVSSSSS